MRKSRNRYFYHIFVSPVDAPGAITLNVVWMEIEFDAYKCLAACAHLSITVSEIQRYILWKKSAFYHTPLAFDAPVRGSRRNFGTSSGTDKLEWCRYPTVKKCRRYVYSFSRDPRTWQTDAQTGGQTDGRTVHDSKDRGYASHRAVKTSRTGWNTVRKWGWWLRLLQYVDCLVWF